MEAGVMREAVRLPFTFDPAGLKADLALACPDEWTAHFNTQYFDGEWSGVALRAVQGTRTPLFAGPNSGTFADTDLLARCPHVRAVLECFRCPLKAVRLLKLAPSSVIREHRDYDLGYDAGEVRIHVPVTTNPGVEFYLNSRRLVMAEGECWYLDLNLPHRVANRSASERVHLVLDCGVNDWLRALLADAGAFELQMNEIDEENAFERFRWIVLNDPALFEQLRVVTESEAFAESALRLGREHGCAFTANDLDAALHAARRGWIERSL
jgi:hypothetical protein